MNSNIIKPKKKTLKEISRRSLAQIKKLSGDPHYVALGMGIGVFVGVTPTIPFHTALALALSFIFRGSKAAAAIGVWFSNPVTIPFFYYGSYKVGAFFMGDSMVPFDPKQESITELFKMGMDVMAAMMAGGIIIGIFPGIAAYFITRKIMTAAKLKKETIQKKRAIKMAAEDGGKSPSIRSPDKGLSEK